MNAVMRSRVASSGCDVSELILILVLPVSFGSTASVGLLGVRGPSCLIFLAAFVGIGAGGAGRLRDSVLELDELGKDTEVEPDNTGGAIA